MAKGYGNLLLTEEGMETALIPEKEREKAVLEFYNMKYEAERHHDRFYALSSVYGHDFSYGVFYPNFYNMTWAEFKACPSLKGIGQCAYDLMQGFCQNPNVVPLDDVMAFAEKDEPRAYTGYSNPKSYPEFVGDRSVWETWHREWYANHQEQIDWSEAENDWLPRPDLARGIMRRELINTLGRDKAVMIADSDVATLFHENVMKHQGDNLEAFALTIGGEICLCNYYVHERELSVMEHRQTNSLRGIYSIVNRHGQRQFISIDFRHGMFEFHNKRGVHLGEYRFDGSFNSGPDERHSLRCIEEWERQNR